MAVSPALRPPSYGQPSTSRCRGYHSLLYSVGYRGVACGPRGEPDCGPQGIGNQYFYIPYTAPARPQAAPRGYPIEFYIPPLGTEGCFPRGGWGRIRGVDVDISRIPVPRRLQHYYPIYPIYPPTPLPPTGVRELYFHIHPIPGTMEGATCGWRGAYGGVSCVLSLYTLYTTLPAPPRPAGRPPSVKDEPVSESARGKEGGGGEGL